MNATPFKTVNTVEAKNKLNALLAQVSQTQEPIIVEKRGRPVAVVLDYDSYQEKLKEKVGGGSSRKNRFVQEMKALHRMMRKEYPQGTGDSVEILREIRGERVRQFE